MITESQGKYIDPGPLKRLKKVLVEWQSMQDTSWWEEKNDAPWWYNERASLSLFAGAVWKCKGWVFEEFITKKHMTTRKGKRKNRHGRGDIMFGIKGQGFVAEAKQCWPNIGRNIDSVLKEVESYLESALDGVYQEPNYGLQRVGIVFVSPRIHRSQVYKFKKTELKKRLNNFRSRLLRRIKNVTIAWNFPKGWLQPKGREKYIYPGIILLIKSRRILKE